MNSLALRRVAPLLLALAALLLNGCTKVEVRFPLLTEANADDIVLEKYYLYYPPFAKEPADAFEAVNLGRLRNTRATPAWAVKGWNARESGVLLVQFLGDNRYLGQLTTVTADNRTKIELALCEKKGAELHVREIGAVAARNAGSHPLLQPLASSISYDEKNYRLVFDELAVAQHGAQIIEFFKSLKPEQLGASTQILVPTRDARLVEALWAKKRREEAQYQADRKAEVANISPGDVMVHDIGFGILGYSKVVVVAIRDESPRVKVTNLDGTHTRWVNAQELISEGAANSKKAEVWKEVLTPLFEPKDR